MSEAVVISRKEAFDMMAQGKYDIWVGDMQRIIGEKEFIAFTPVDKLHVKDLKEAEDTSLVFLTRKTEEQTSKKKK